MKISPDKWKSEAKNNFRVFIESPNKDSSTHDRNENNHSLNEGNAGKDRLKGKRPSYANVPQKSNEQEREGENKDSSNLNDQQRKQSKNANKPLSSVRSNT